MQLFSVVDARGTGNYQLVATPEYLLKEHIRVYVDGLPTEAFEWINDRTIRLIAPVNRLVRIVRRTSPEALLTDYKDGAQLPGDTLRMDSKQAFFLAQEAFDVALLAGGSAGGSPAPGVELTTEGIKQLLLGQITPSLLELTLREDIGLITAGPGTTGSPAWHASEEARARSAAIIAEAEARFRDLQAEAINRGAAIQVEKTERQQADSSLAQQITQVTASTGQNTAALQSEVSARTSADAALATAITQLEVDFKAADTALSASISEVQQATATADSALAQSIETVKSQIGGGDNLFPNPNFLRGAGTPGLSDADIVDRTAPESPPDAPSARVLRHTGRVYGVGDRIPCAPGDTFEVDIWVGLNAPLSGSLPVGVSIRMLTPAGAPITYQYITTAGSFTGWRRASGFITTPANTGFIEILLFVDRSGVGLTPVYFSTPVVKRKAASLAAVETNASTIATKLAGVEANYTIKVQARTDGKNAIAGIGLNATSNGASTQSEIVMMADKFTFVPSQADVNAIPQPILVMGLVNGQNTLVLPPSRLGDKLVEARMIVEGTIEARHLKVNSITSDRIDSRGLVLKDAAGNVTFGNGVNLDWTKINPSSGWLNSNVATVSLINTAACLIEGTKVTKVGGSSSSWDAGFRSRDAFSGGAYVSFVPALAGCSLGVGLNDDPGADSSYEGITFWMYCQLDGGLYPFVNGVSFGTPSTWAPGDVLSVSYDGVVARWFKNGALLWSRSEYPGIDVPLYLDGTIQTVNAVISNIQFGPLSNNLWSSVGGAGKPQDNATYGATIGGTLGGSFTQASWDNYMTSALIRSAHIQSLSANKIAVTNGLSDISGNVGLLRTASSGGRQEIEANRTRIFDQYGALRYVHGYLL